MSNLGPDPAEIGVVQLQAAAFAATRAQRGCADTCVLLAQLVVEGKEIGGNVDHDGRTLTLHELQVARDLVARAPAPRKERERAGGGPGPVQ